MNRKEFAGFVIRVFPEKQWEGILLHASPKWKKTQSLLPIKRKKFSYIISSVPTFWKKNRVTINK